MIEWSESVNLYHDWFEVVYVLIEVHRLNCHSRSCVCSSSVPSVVHFGKSSVKMKTYSLKMFQTMRRENLPGKPPIMHHFGKPKHTKKILQKCVLWKPHLIVSGLEVKVRSVKAKKSHVDNLQMLRRDYRFHIWPDMDSPFSNYLHKLVHLCRVSAAWCWPYNLKTHYNNLKQQ